MPRGMAGVDFSGIIRHVRGSGGEVTSFPSLRGAQRRSNPDFRCGLLDCFAALAMTANDD